MMDQIQKLMEMSKELNNEQEKAEEDPDYNDVLDQIKDDNFFDEQGLALIAGMLDRGDMSTYGMPDVIWTDP